MIGILHVIISFFVVILHTAILNSPYLHSLGVVLLFAFLLFLACQRPLYESLAIVLLIGILMDSFSGGPFGLFASTCFWLFAVIKYGVRFLRLQNSHAIRFLILFCVLMENLILFSAMMLINGKMSLTIDIWRLLVVQTGFAVLLGPASFELISRLYAFWDTVGRSGEQTRDDA